MTHDEQHLQQEQQEETAPLMPEAGMAAGNDDPSKPPRPLDPKTLEAGAVLLLDKPLTWTSFDVVRKVKNTLRVKKIGHAGTLDPLATGLLILCTGKKTKQIDDIQAQEKEYTGTFRLGQTTSSFDLETPVDAELPFAHLTEAEIQAATAPFVGRIEQTPPLFSAVKVNGERGLRRGPPRRRSRHQKQAHHHPRV